MKSRVVFAAAIFFFLETAFSFTAEKPPKPPHGYLNTTILKLAYVAHMIKLVDTEPETPPTIMEFRDIVYKEIDGQALKLDIYKQKDLQQAAPLLVFIHGGGWKSGKKEDYRLYTLDFAEKGFVTASISYRLSGIAKYPAAIEDVKCAVRWLRAHADEYGFDSDRIALIGGSAGGHLSLLAGYADEQAFAAPCDAEVSSRVQAVVDLYGPVDLTTEWARTHNLTTSFFGMSYEDAPERYRQASPLHWLTSDDPPTLIFQGTIDELVPVSQSDTLHAALDRAGVFNEYHRLKGWPHTMDLSKKVNDYCQYYMERFFRRVFETSKMMQK